MPPGMCWRPCRQDERPDRLLPSSALPSGARSAKEGAGEGTAVRAARCGGVPHRPICPHMNATLARRLYTASSPLPLAGEGTGVRAARCCGVHIDVFVCT